MSPNGLKTYLQDVLADRPFEVSLHISPYADSYTVRVKPTSYAAFDVTGEELDAMDDKALSQIEKDLQKAVMLLQNDICEEEQF